MNTKEKVVNRLLDEGRKTQKFYIDIWNFVNIEEVNEVLDGITEKKQYIASDITYKCLKISTKGTLQLEADYVPEEY